MLRKFHSWSGLMAALLVVLLSITGAVLSVNPFLERTQAKVAGTSSISVAELTGKIASRYPGAEQIQRTPSGSIIVYFTADGQTGADLINPITGKTIGTYSTSPIMVWVKNLHRSYLLDTPGRVGAGIGAFLMLLLTFSGAFMLANRLGGWRHILRPLQGSFKQRLHCQVGRVAVLGLLLSASTGLYMSAVTFELIPPHQSAEPAFPENVKGGVPASVDTLPALKAISVTEIRELIYPYPQDQSDVYSITTDQGRGFIDQATGELLSYQPYGSKQNIYEFIYKLHTGEGLWWLGLLVGLSALTVPLMTWTGIQVWWSRKKSATTIKNNTAARLADTVILVGSESNSTWGFAKTLHDALHLAGYLVHTTAMNSLASNYPHAKRLFILTSTYGDGDAPASASQFMARLEKITDMRQFPVAVLGFGDRQFPQFCQFAKDVEAALTAKGWPQLLPLDTINRQSPQAYARWGEAISKVLDSELTLVHTPVHPRSSTLVLVERVDYGMEVQAPTSVLRFKTPKGYGKGLLSRLLGHFLRRSGLPHFEAGDLVGILAPGTSVPRFYSLASASKDGVLEICVRQHPGGLCSGFLHALSLGDIIEAFIQPNPSFRPAAGKAPIVLIGAGTGIGPLVGFIRNNKAHHPIHLYWGGRCPESDFLYEAELNIYLKDKRLTELIAVFSRVSERSYVQDKIIVDGAELRRLIEKDAQILVCGGRNMAGSVTAALNDIIAPLGIDVLTLKAQGRYREDVY
ncbi:PepSY domain-containing protein [Neptunomonas antarctica]|uniref:Sulfite reductase (NADPH) flavoprotein alpha-component n=1 Tax=Neptunomonas antarctica TaxID=619304 RepID=A0A1N7NGS5_9GAMM|nr:PepSY domain-containing protein [Neptunomonas antarctica]SIS97585.1 sulfite reductase (NADPH) flavoprotein alpha-component [Neptunomonas antarctica]